MFIAQSQVFTDQTNKVGIDSFYVEIQYGSGSNLVDVDGNGFIDLFVLADAYSPNQLFYNYGTSWSEPVEIGDSYLNSRAAVWFDYNCDKLLDVFIASDCAYTSSCYDYEAFALYKNNGDGTFSNVSEESMIATGMPVVSAISFANYTGGVTAGDINLDGHLDLLITRWGGELFLYENNGDGTFNLTSGILGQADLHFYWQPVIYNLDDDVWPEIYVNLDADEENIYLDRRSESVLYDNKARENNVNHKLHDMGVVVGDFDNDQDYDLYVSNIDRFEESRNVLFSKRSGTGYDEVANATNVDRAGWAWGVTFSDINNDGLLDLGVTNGWEAHDQYRHDQSKFWLGSDEFKFIDVSESTQFNDTLNASSLSSADLDRDGDIDLVQGLKSYYKDVHLRVLKNDLKESCTDCNYLVIKPRMMGQNHWGIGSSVSVKTSSGQQMRAITAGVGFYSQEPAEAFFGLASETTVEEVAIRWPSGDSTIINNIDANQILTIYDSTALHKVGQVNVYLSDPTTLELEWGHMSTLETEFIIQRSENPEFASYEETILSSTIYTYTDTNLEENTDYYYRVKASNSTGDSKWSETSIGSTRIEVPAPFDLTGIANDNFTVNIAWNDSSNIVAGYELQRSLNPDFEHNLSYIINNGINSFVDNNVEPGYTYHYRVKLNSQIHECPYSDILSIDIPGISNPLSTKVNSEIVIYPNPSTGMVFFTDLDTDLVMVHSIDGKLIQFNPITDGDNERSLKIEKKGIYLLSFYKNRNLIKTTRIAIH